MATVLPGTAIEVSRIEKGISRAMADGIFLTGGITLAQVSVMPGVEPAAIQNWVKRGFVSSPQKRMYSKNQFARICIINMLREALQLEKIIELLQYINGNLYDESDDLIDDIELYHRYVDMLADADPESISDKAIAETAKKAAEGYIGPTPGAAKRLESVLSVMAYAHFSVLARHKAELMLKTFDDNSIERMI